MGSLDGCNTLVTGASRGIGAAIARRLASEGTAVAVTARSLEARRTLPGTLVETVETIAKEGGRAVALRADLMEPADRERLVDEARARLGPIDILVNNAAVAFDMPFLAVTEKRFRVAFEINVRAPWDLAQRVLPDMKEKGRGWIVNVSSATAGHPTGPPFDPFHREGGAVLYGATKAALDRISTGLAGEFHAHGVAVNSLSPVAAVMTPGVEALGVVPEEFRASAEPVENLAEATLALCEARELSITGRVLYSRPLLDELGRAVRTLDGRRPLPGRDEQEE